MKLANKVAVVTGGTRGIGLAISLALADEGCDVVINYAHDDIAAEIAQQKLNDHGRNCLLVKADIGSCDGVRYLHSAAFRRFNQVDILVNNAGINTSSNLFDIKESDWDNVVNTNLKGSFFCSQVFGKSMLDQGNGCIINISSTAAYQPKPTSHHYIASKSGLIGLTKALALSLAPNVRVNSIVPGYVATERWQLKPAEEKAFREQSIPLKRIGLASEIASAVVFISSDAHYMTGQALFLDGGLSLT